jgi:hypothetical protein
MPAEARECAETKAAKPIAGYALDELRETRSMTQARLADIPGKDQPVISRIERRSDMYVSTLAGFIVSDWEGFQRVREVSETGATG